IISISFSHLLNTNTSPASNSSLIASFRLSRDSSSSSLSRNHLPDSSTLYPLLATTRNTLLPSFQARATIPIRHCEIREKLQGALGSIAYNKSEDALALIRLQLEDRPLTQIIHLRSAKEAWDKLKDLYNPVSQGYAL
ncbi:hypothetical protein L249_5537, partial [Ophiocordyceps polyrhachis-furcata BCC 54312]